MTAICCQPELDLVRGWLLLACLVTACWCSCLRTETFYDCCSGAVHIRMLSAPACHTVCVHVSPAQPTAICRCCCCCRDPGLLPSVSVSTGVPPSALSLCNPPSTALTCQLDTDQVRWVRACGSTVCAQSG
jgi:hypothetical protein